MARFGAAADQRALVLVLGPRPLVFVFIDRGPSARCVRAFVAAVSAAQNTLGLGKWLWTHHHHGGHEDDDVWLWLWSSPFALLNLLQLQSPLSVIQLARAKLICIIHAKVA